MTSPGGNNVNLATLWVPMMPETSHMEEAARKGGEAARRGFESGFGSGGGVGLSQLGQTMATQLASGFKQGMSHLELPGGFTNLTEGAMRGFEGMSTRSESARAALEKLRESEEQLVNSHNRLAVAQSRMNDLQQRGVTSGTQYLSASSGLIGAKQREESAVRSVSEAHEGYANALSASKGGMFAFAAETGILAGAVAGAIPLVGSLIEGIIDFWKEAAEKGVEVSIEFAKKLMEIGEEYHHLGIQVREFSSATGEAFEELESAAQRVYSTLDVAGETTGKTMAVLSSRLKTTDVEALEPLVRHVEELHGRFSDLNPTDVATAFAAMRVDIHEADDVLASWLQSARTAGVSTGALVESLAKVGEILRPEVTKLSAQQLGEWIAQMQSVVPNVSRTVTALNAAQKDFTAHGMTFSEGMTEAIKELQSAATEFDKEELAEKLFGTRRWSVALDMAERYAQIVAKGPEAFNRAGSDIDDFTRRTQDLGNKWEEVKKQIERALLPLGETLLSKFSGALDHLNNTIHSHSDQIAQWVKHIGESFIALLPTLQTWAIDILEVLKPVAQGIEIWGSGLLLTIGGVAQSLATSMDILPGPLAHLIPGFDDARKAAHGMADATLDMGKKMAQARNPTGEFFDAVTGKVRDLHIDVPGLTRDFDGLADSLGRRLGEAADQGINRPGLGSGLHLPGAPGGEPGAPGGEPAAPGGPPERPEPGGPQRVPPGGAPGAAPGARPSGVQTPAQQGVYRAMVEAGFPNSWAAISSIVAGEDASWDVTAQNNSDINARQGNPSRGIGQLTLSNYRAAGVNPYTNDAYEQGRAMMSYIKGRYGTPEKAWEHWQGSHNYQYGGIVGLNGGGDPGTPLDPGGVPYSDPEWKAFREYFSHTGQFNPNMRIDTSTTNRPGLSPFRAQWNQGLLNWSDWIEDSKSGRSGGIDRTAAQWIRNHLMFDDGGIIPVIDPTIGPYHRSRLDAEHPPMYPMPGHGTRGQYDDPSMSPDSPILKWPGSHHIPEGPYHAAYGWEVKGGKGGIDDIPAWLTAGEFVMNKRATAKWRKVLQWMNAQAFQGGSNDPVTAGSGSGLKNDSEGVDQEILGVTYIANKLGLRLTAGKSGHGTHDVDRGHHDSGEAGDFSNGIQTPEELAFSQYLIQNFTSEMAELIHDSPALPQLVKDGKLYPKSIYAKDLPGHRNHVHVAFRPGSSKRLEQLAIQTGQGAGATAAGVAPGSVSFPAGYGAGGSPGAPGGGGGAGTPGSPGSPSAAPGGPDMGPLGVPPIGSPASTAGYGPYGFQTYDQWYQGNKAITGAQTRVTDINAQITEKQQQLDKLNTEITEEQGKPQLLRDQAKLDAKTQERDRLTGELTKLRNTELPAASGEVEQAQRKAWEDAQKPPGGQQEYRIPGASEFSQLGGGLIKGMSQAFGFGDIFAKPPWEWGIVKLMSGMANWGLGTANAWAEEIGKGHTGMTGYQPVAGMEQSGAAGLEGVLKGFGLNVPMPKPQQVDRFGRPVGAAGPNVQAGPAPGSPGADGAGGPVIQGDYMPINVSPNVNPSAILGPVQAQRNADSASLHTYTGGMPPP